MNKQLLKLSVFENFLLNIQLLNLMNITIFFLKILDVFYVVYVYFTFSVILCLKNKRIPKLYFQLLVTDVLQTLMMSKVNCERNF